MRGGGREPQPPNPKPPQPLNGQFVQFIIFYQIIQLFFNLIYKISISFLISFLFRKGEALNNNHKG